MPIDQNNIVWDAPTKKASPSSLDDALIDQESGGNWNVSRKDSGATGGYQITPIYLKEGNNILGSQFTLQEMKDPEKAQAVKDAVSGSYKQRFISENGREPSLAEDAMMHHGGPHGYRKPKATDSLGMSNERYAQQVTGRVVPQIDERNVVWDAPPDPKNIVRDAPVVAKKEPGILENAGRFVSDVVGNIGDAVSGAVDFIAHPKGIQTRDLGADLQPAIATFDSKGGDSIPTTINKTIENVPAYADAIERKAVPIAVAYINSFPEFKDTSIAQFLREKLFSSAYQTDQLEARPVQINAKGGVTGAIKDFGPNIPALAAGVVSPMLGASMFGIQTAGDIYEQDKTQGIPDSAAVDHAMVSGTLQAALFSIPIHKVLGPLMAPELKFFQRVLGGSVTGEVFSKFSQAVQLGVDKGTVKPDMTMGDAWKQWSENGNGIGAFLGGAIGAATHPFAYRSTTYEPIAGWQNVDLTDPRINKNLRALDGGFEPPAQPSGLGSQPPPEPIPDRPSPEPTRPTDTVTSEPSAQIPVQKKSMSELVAEKMVAAGIDPQTALPALVQTIARQPQPIRPEAPATAIEQPTQANQPVPQEVAPVATDGQVLPVPEVVPVPVVAKPVTSGATNGAYVGQPVRSTISHNSVYTGIEKPFKEKGRKDSIQYEYEVLQGEDAGKKFFTLVKPEGLSVSGKPIAPAQSASPAAETVRPEQKKGSADDDALWDTSTSESFKSLPEYAQQAIFEHHAEGVTNKRVHRGLITADWEKVTVPVESLREKNSLHFDFKKQEEYVGRKIYNSGPVVLDFNGELVDGNHRFNKAVRDGDKVIDVYRPIAAAKDVAVQPEQRKAPWQMTKGEFESESISPESAKRIIEQRRAGDERSKHKGVFPGEDPMPRQPMVETEIPISIIPNSEIETLSDASNKKRVEEYSKQKISTPVTVVRSGQGGLFVSDGGHRIMAAIKRGDKTIPALISQDVHKEIVKNALSEGKPVPPEVLAEYPDLAKRSDVVPAPEAVPATPEVSPKQAAFDARKNESKKFKKDSVEILVLSNYGKTKTPTMVTGVSIGDFIVIKDHTAKGFYNVTHKPSGLAIKTLLPFEDAKKLSEMLVGTRRWVPSERNVPVPRSDDGFGLQDFRGDVTSVLTDFNKWQISNDFAKREAASEAAKNPPAPIAMANPDAEQLAKDFAELLGQPVREFHKMYVNGILSKDFDTIWRSIGHHGNKASEKMFTKITGIKVPGKISDRSKVISDWTGTRPSAPGEKQDPAEKQVTPPKMTKQEAFEKMKAAKEDAVENRANYTTSDGGLKQGILMPRGYKHEKSSVASFVSGSQVADFIAQGGVARSDDKVVKAWLRDGVVRIEVVQSKQAGGKYFLDKKLLDVVGGFVSASGVMRVDIHQEIAAESLERMRTIGAKFVADGKEDIARKIIEGGSDESGVQALRNSAPNTMPNYQPPYSKIGMPQRPASGEIEIGNRTVKLTPEDKPTRIESIRRQVEELIGRGLYHGKIKGKMEGFFRGQNAEVRIGKYNDIETMAHEAAHFISEYGDRGRFVKALYKRYADELKQLSYTDVEGKQASEGFAEYMRLWFTQYKEAESRAPEFTKAFEHFLLAKANKKFAGQMRRLQDDMHRWFYQGDMARLEAVTGGNQYTTQERVTAWVAQRPLSLMRQHFIDNLHAAKVMEREIHGDIRDANLSAYKQLQLINGVEGTIQESMLHGAPYFAANGDIMFKGPSQESIWKESLGKGIRGMRVQELYFASRRMAETKMQGRENLADDGMIKAGLDLAINQPSLKDAFRDYQEHNDLMRAFYVDCGYVEQAAADKWGKVNRNYVPFNREVEGISTSFAGAGSGNLKRLKGGTQNLKHIYDNIMLSEAQHIKAALRCRAIRSLYMDALNSQEGGKFVAPLGPDSKLVRSTIEAQAKVIAKAMMELGLTLSSDGMIVSGNPTADQITEVSDIIQVLEDNPEMMQFWTFGHKPKTVETQVDSFINPKTGKRQWVEIKSELVADMIDNLAGARIPDGWIGAIIKGLIFVKQMQTLTITAAWQFSGPNMVRDTQEAFTRSGGKFIPVRDNIYGIASMFHDLLKREGWYHDMKAQGGGGGGRVRAVMTDTYHLQEGPMAPVTRSKYHPVRVGQQIVDGLMAVADFAEMSTRVGFYIRLRKQGVSAREAAWQARELTVDFRKHGSYAPMELLKSTVPFLGASIQGIDRDIRMIAEDKGKMDAKNIAKINKAKARIYAVGGAFIVAGIALALLNGNDDRYEELTPDQKTRFFHFFVGDNHYTIPKPRGVFPVLFMNAGEAFVDTMKGQSVGDAGKFLAFAVAYEFGVDILPGALSPALDLARNKNFTDAPIIGERLKGLSPEYQFTDRTSIMYINVGRALKISPDAAQFLVKSYTGYVSDYVNEAADALMWNTEKWGERPFAKNAGDFIGKQFIQKSVPYRTKWTANYYDLKKQAGEQAANLAYLQKSSILRDPDSVEVLARDERAMNLASASSMFKKVDAIFSNQEMIIASIKYDRDLSAAEKERQIDAYYREKNSALKDVYQAIEKVLK